ncbi:hypothetical protein C7M84_001689 [Penaeus vannamei]|uniref:Uncharacterized protein n=1 Tax=Penaeus vannamei TaxID=6689 RepID=A0A423TSZ5_PENVA|nr:hypothetical protein C7M84_001689 [Penaeus vannamei]
MNSTPHFLHINSPLSPHPPHPSQTLSPTTTQPTTPSLYHHLSPIHPDPAPPPPSPPPPPITPPTLPHKPPTTPHKSSPHHPPSTHHLPHHTPTNPPASHPPSCTPTASLLPTTCTSYTTTPSPTLTSGPHLLDEPFPSTHKHTLHFQIPRSPTSALSRPLSATHPTSVLNPTLTAPTKRTHIVEPNCLYLRHALHPNSLCCKFYCATISVPSHNSPHNYLQAPRHHSATPVPSASISARLSFIPIQRVPLYKYTDPHLYSDHTPNRASTLPISILPSGAANNSPDRTPLSHTHLSLSTVAAASLSTHTREHNALRPRSSLTSEERPPQAVPNTIFLLCLRQCVPIVTHNSRLAGAFSTTDHLSGYRTPHYIHPPSVKSKQFLRAAPPAHRKLCSHPSARCLARRRASDTPPSTELSLPYTAPLQSRPVPIYLHPVLTALASDTKLHTTLTNLI